MNRERERERGRMNREGENERKKAMENERARDQEMKTHAISQPQAELIQKSNKIVELWFLVFKTGLWATMCTCSVQLIHRPVHSMCEFVGVCVRPRYVLLMLYAGVVYSSVQTCHFSSYFPLIHRYSVARAHPNAFTS